MKQYIAEYFNSFGDCIPNAVNLYRIHGKSCHQIKTFDLNSNLPALYNEYIKLMENNCEVILTGELSRVDIASIMITLQRYCNRKHTQYKEFLFSYKNVTFIEKDKGKSR